MHVSGRPVRARREAPSRSRTTGGATAGRQGDAAREEDQGGRNEERCEETHGEARWALLDVGSRAGVVAGEALTQPVRPRP